MEVELHAGEPAAPAVRGLAVAEAHEDRPAAVAQLVEVERPLLAVEAVPLRRGLLQPGDPRRVVGRRLDEELVGDVERERAALHVGR